MSILKNTGKNQDYVNGFFSTLAKENNPHTSFNIEDLKTENQINFRNLCKNINDGIKESCVDNRGVEDQIVTNSYCNLKLEEVMKKI